MKVTAIIPSLYTETADYLKLAVESLRETVDWDIIVVTNGSMAKPKLDHIKGITIHLHTPAQGQCVAVNTGAQIASPDTDYLFIANDDMYFAPDWNKNLRFDDLVFSPNLVEPDNNNGSAPPFLKLGANGYTLEEFDKDVVDNFINNHVLDAYGRTEEEDGFNFPVFVNREVWRTIGGYDQAYDPWGSNSDTDLQTKFLLAGIMPKRYRDVLVYHFSNKSGTFDGTHQEEWQRNFDYYTHKWGFNRDMLPTDVWYCKDVLPENESMIKYNPPWKGRYEKPEEN